MASQNNFFSRFLSTIKEADNNTPRIELLKKLKKVKISGISRMTDPVEFYTQLSAQLENCFYEFNNNLFIEFYFEYMNSGSAKWLFFVLEHLQELMRGGGMIQVTWKYETDDESIEETGEYLKSRLALPFILKAVE